MTRWDALIRRDAVGRWDAWVRAGGLALVWLGTAAVLAGLILPWARGGQLRPDALTLGGIAFLGPLLSATGLAMVRFEPARRTYAVILGGAGSAAAAAIAVGVTDYVDPRAGIALGGPLVAVGAGYAALGWLALGLAGPGPVAAGRPLLAVLTVVALLAVLGGTGIRWYSEARFVDHRTVAAAGELPVTTPAALDTERWHRSQPGTAVIGVAGRYLVLRDAAGVRAVDASTGEPRWHYLRTDVPLRSAVLTGRQKAVVAVFGTGSGVLAVELDAATGEQLWAHRHDGADLDPDRLLAADDGPDGQGFVALVGIGPDAGDVVALDSRTGQRRWAFQPRNGPDRCGIADAVTAGSTLAVVVRCRATGIRDSVVALSTVDGKRRWGWDAGYGGSFPAGEAPSVASTGTGVVVRYGQAPQRALILDADQGRVHAGHTAPGALVTVAGDTLLYLTTDAFAAELVAVDAAGGTVRWAISLQQFAGHRLVASAADAGAVYLLLRGGSLRVVAASTGDGSIRADRELPCVAPCTDRPGGLLIGPGLILVADQRAEGTSMELTALG